MSKLVVILGPTSSGKTSLALELCHRHNGEIISADSRQVYRLMNIGTNKGLVELIKDGFSSHWSLKGIPVWGINLVNPDHDFSVGEYLAYSIPKIKEIWKREKIPFLVGGTGFYIDAVLGNTSIARVPSQPEFRSRCESLSNQELLNNLRTISHDWAAKIDPLNKRRLIRALEVETYKDKYYQGDLPLLEAQETLLIGLSSLRETLYERADRWADSIWQTGLLEESKELNKAGYKNTRPVRGIIYSIVFDYLDGKLTNQPALERIKFDLHSYIRRQLTWFKKTPKVIWLDSGQDDYCNKAEILVRAFINKE